MEVVVEDKQLSLAIGKKGQNVRLAAKIVGWRIDIKSEEEKRREVEAEMARMARIVDELKSLERFGVSEKISQKLIDAGVAGLAHLLDMTDEDMTVVEGVGPKTAEKIREAATQAKVEWDEFDAEAERLEAEQAAAEAAAAEEEAAAEEAAALAETQAEASTEDASETEAIEPDGDVTEPSEGADAANDADATEPAEAAEPASAEEPQPAEDAEEPAREAEDSKESESSVADGEEDRTDG